MVYHCRKQNKLFDFFLAGFNQSEVEYVGKVYLDFMG
jgi:hypothetical protein